MNPFIKYHFLYREKEKETMKKTYYLPTHHIVGLIILQFALIIKP